MENKGFTLIELLGVILILGILALVTFPPLLNQIKNSKTEIDEATKLLIIDAAKDYVADNENSYNQLEGITYCINVKTLTDTNYLNGKIKDKNLNDISTNNKVKLVYNNNNFDYEVVKECTNNTYDEVVIEKKIASEAQAIRDNISSETPDGIYYYDGNGNLESKKYTIRIGNDSKYKGNIMIHNHQFISGCINYGDKNFSYYKTNIGIQNYPCSTMRGENLAINGDMSYKNNFNFSQFSYNSGGYISCTSSGSYKDIESNIFIPVDIENNAYTFGATVKTNNTSATNYMGIKEYDIDKNQIFPQTVMYLTSNDITLTQDLKNGDEYVYLSDLSTWNKTTSAYYQRGFIFWNYKDSTGYQYEPYTYSRNIWWNLYENSNIDTANNRIKLTEKWNHGTIPAGTKLSQCNSGSSFNYGLYEGRTLSTSWTQFSRTTRGIRKSGSTSYLEFRAGTKFVKFGWLHNYNGVSNATADFKDLYIKEVIE